MADDPPLGEAEIIRRYFAPLAKGTAGAFGLMDDAAFLACESGDGLVLTTDTLIADVHFRAADPPGHVGHKALAVNLSDLAAKGAEPVCYLLSLALPHAPDPAWLEAFAEGLGTIQRTHGCGLAGGDTVATPGPVSITITALGRAGDRGMVPRTGAREGEHVYVTGTIGDAALGLQVLNDDSLAGRWGLTEEATAFLCERYWLPEPRLGAIEALRAHASAAMDVSDGLAGDLAKLCLASGVGAEIDTARVPLSKAARTALEAAPGLLETLITGGDDYEILATVPTSQQTNFEAACREAGLQATRIGRIAAAEAGLIVAGPDGHPLALEHASYDHFG